MRRSCHQSHQVDSPLCGDNLSGIGTRARPVAGDPGGRLKGVRKICGSSSRLPTLNWRRPIHIANSSSIRFPYRDHSNFGILRVTVTKQNERILLTHLQPVDLRMALFHPLGEQKPTDSCRHAGTSHLFNRLRCKDQPTFFLPHRSCIRITLRASQEHLGPAAAAIYKKYSYQKTSTGCQLPQACSKLERPKCCND